MRRTPRNDGKVDSLGHSSLSIIQQACLIMLAPAFVAVYGPTIGWLWQKWTTGWSFHQIHGLAVPFAVAFLIWRKMIAYNWNRRAEEGSALGFLFIIPSLAIHVLDTSLWFQTPSALSIVPTLIGLSLLFLGRLRTLHILFPLLLLFFMVPLPSAITQPIFPLLRKISAFGTEEVLSGVGVSFFRSETIFEFVNGSVNIDDPCSGQNTIMATLAFTCVVLSLRPTGLLQSLLLVAFALPVAISANIFRISILSLLVAYLGTAPLHTFLHPLSGYLGFFIAVAAQLSLFKLLKRGKA